MDALLKGVHEIVAPGCLVGPVAVFGEQAFPVITGRRGSNRLPILAAARYGRGRMVLAGHEGLFGSTDRPDQRQLILNIATWLARGRNPARVVLVDHRQVGPVLADAGFQVVTLEPAELESALPRADVLFLAGSRLTARSQAGLLAAVARFIQQGGGWCDGIPGWGWQQLNPGLSLAEDFGGNRLAARAGLAIADGGVDPTGPQGWLADRSGLAFSHAATALSALRRHADGSAPLSREELAQVSCTLTTASGVLPRKDRLLRPALRQLVARRQTASIPLPDRPLTLDDPVGRLACVLQHAEMSQAPLSKVRAHPAAAGFPGSVPANAKRVTQTLTLDTSVPDWHSTGLYAAPGEAIEVRIPPEAVRASLGVRIGAHTDTIWHHDRWTRFPEISRAAALTQQVTRFANPFGGVVYLTVPRGCKLGQIAVTIRGAVQMPLFVAGQTPIELWRSTIRHYPAPWAELATRKIILTLPASVVRTLDDPEAVLQVWDEGMDAIADLAGIPRERERPERICCDQQISAGYMHSGYPIMTFLDVPPVMVDHQRMRSGGSKVCWGFWHELGHNHQSPHWTFSGTGETTCNLFSLYCCERVSGETVDRSAWLNVAERNRTVRRYFEGGARFEEWCRDPGLSLMFYAQLQQAFGWDAFRRVFADYRAAPEDALPKTDDEKRDQFLVRFSRAVGRNLAPFFTAWGIPTSEAARRSLQNLPVWLPPGFQDGIPPADNR